MKRIHLLRVLIVVVAVVAFLFMIVAIGGTVIGQTRPERVAYAYEVHLSGTPREVWRKLRMPDQHAQVRESRSGTRYVAGASDTTGRLIMLCAPDSLMVRVTYFPRVTITTTETFKPDGDGTLMEVETRAWLGGAWHRLMFPGLLKRQTIAYARYAARDTGDPEAVITETARPDER